MQTHLSDVLNDSSLAQSLATSGLETVREHHTCAHRADELLSIYDAIKPAGVAVESPAIIEVGQ
jgi:spore maturation protein CgeB